jgi:hypothetical protein
MLSTRVIALLALVAAACGGREPGAGVAAAAQDGALPGETPAVPPTVIPAPTPQAEAPDPVVAPMPPTVADALEARGIRITADGIIGPGFMITDDGIIAPGVEITKNRLRVMIAADGPELEGLKGQLKELEALLESTSKAHVGLVRDGHLRIGDIELAIGDDGDIDIDIDLEADELEQLIGEGSAVRVNLGEILEWAAAGDDSDEHEVVAGAPQRFTCGEGDCAEACAKGERCVASCAGGGCRQTCGDGATCRLTCAGGDCFQRCEGGATCKLTCAGGGCRRACATGAKCETSCLGDDCSGPE